MILYYILTKHEQIACMLHKLMYAKNETAHLYISNINNIDVEEVERIKQSNIFDDVIIMNDKQSSSIANKYNLFDDTQIYSALEEITELCSQSLVVNLEEYDEYYIAADHCYFAFTLLYKGIRYHYIEEATSAYSNYDLWIEILKKQNAFFSVRMSEIYGLQGRSELVIDKWIDVDSQKDKINFEEDNNIIDFPVSKLLYDLDEQSKEIILGVYYSSDCFDNKSDSVLLLTEYLSHAQFCTWNEHKNIYCRLIDYFCEDSELYIKPHPNDFEGIYGEWFVNAKIIDRNVPSEVLPLIFKNKVGKLISITSTSAPAVSFCSDELLYFRNQDLRSLNLLKHIDLYFAGFEMVKEYVRYDNVFGIGADCNQIKYFINNEEDVGASVREYDNQQRFTDNKIVFVDDLSFTDNVLEFDVYNYLDNSFEDDIFVFLNSREDVLFWDDEKKWSENVIPVMIEIKDKGKTVEEKWIYFYTRSIKVQEELLTKTIERKLKNSNIDIVVNNKDKSIREKMLEGMLIATEQKCNLLLRRK